jgi:hypothetical protein
MRTTIDLPDDLHRVLVSVARDRSQSLSRTVVDVVRKALEPDVSSIGLTRSPITGLLVMHGSGKPITNDDVRALEDE